VQLEVAERLAAQPGVRDYGYLSTFAQLYSRPEILLRIPPGAFNPPPQVASALVALPPPGARARLGLTDEHAFLEFLKRCFAQKRKTLRNNLAGLHERSLVESLVGPKDRSEQLSVPDLAKLFTSLTIR